ncbi:hypothetical protein P3T27_002137 [Kitasatospora sp. MAA19]|uniref:DUF3987 domain-containing protein n=1 Tax=Kitasatospora sp. MAA19 TaxID=3035090 RepID=UPI0024769959|nr:DUF3987 domain-containing protein [Kitasatospora sp. MAA19]MDH6705427.1 hypothetical protein [Kitasatospora sp. MAA19]
MGTWDEMKYGPLGEAVDNAREWSEGDPVGIFAAALSMWSSAISGSVVQPNGRPVVVWTAMVGRSKVGRKGFALDTAYAALAPSIGSFLEKRTRKGISSGPALVNTLFEVVQETALSEEGEDGRVLMVEDEWATQLRRANRDDSYFDQLICAWDGKSMVNTTKGKAGKREEQRVDHPLLGFHGHIQPGRWVRLVRPDAALGGFFNRLCPVLVEQTKRLPTRIKKPLANVQETPALTRAYKWARAEPRVMALSDAAAERHDNYRAELEDQLMDLPEELSCMIERADEQVLRIACVLTAAERKTAVSVRAWEAARAFVDYSVASIRRLASEADSVGRRPAKPLPDVIRETLQRYGGEATSSVLLRALGSRANAAGVKAAVEQMDDVDMVRERIGGRGAPATIYRLADPKPAVVERPKPAPAPIGERAVESVMPVPVRTVQSVVESKPIKATKAKAKKAGKKAVVAKPQWTVVAGERPASAPVPARKAASKPKAAAKRAANPFRDLL